MDLTPYVESLRQDLRASAATGGESVVAAAERLAVALDPAMRMALLEALSHAAAEITTDLRGGSVEVRLRGRDPQFVVTPPPDVTPDVTPASVDATEGAAALDEVEDTADGPLARITLRIPEGLKQRAEEAAARHGQSLNSWLIAAVRAATRERAINIDVDLSSMPFGSAPGRGRRGPGQHVRGWGR